MKSIQRPSVYEALREKGYPKERAAKIANSPPKTGVSKKKVSK